MSTLGAAGFWLLLAGIGFMLGLAVIELEEELKSWRKR